MKLPLILLGVAICALPVKAQDAQTAKWDQDYKHSEDLAIKLYPDVANPDSQLAKMTTVEHRILRANGSRLPNLSTYPLILCLYAAAHLHLTAQWANLTDGERQDVYDAMLGTLACTKDFADPDMGQTSSTAPQSAQPQLKPSRNGYLYFYNYLAHQSGGVNSNGKFNSGPYAGMNKGQSEDYAQQQWEALSSDDQMAYEQRAQMYGPGPDPDKPGVDGNYNVNITHDQGQ